MKTVLPALAAVLGLALIVVGLWVVFSFEKISTTSPPYYQVRQHPASGAGGWLAVAGAICLLAGAVWGRGGGDKDARRS
jgi:hypothetical protein